VSEVVDTRLGEAERKRLLDEVRNHLPAFLARGASEQADPAGDVSELLNLERRDLDRVIAVHACLSEPIRAFFEALRTGLRQPISSTVREPETTQAVRGSIDWGATVATRARSAGGRSVFVTRPAQRLFDTPENRALAWLLETLGKQLRRVGVDAVAPGDEDERGWYAELAARRFGLSESRRHLWLRSIPAERPDRRAMARLRAARSAFYSRSVADAIETLDRYTRAPSGDDLADMLCRRFFRPREDWRLFEVVVALRLARAFAAIAPDGRRSRLLVAGGGGPYAVYELGDGVQVRLHYQRWPNGAGRSLHAETRRRHGLQAGEPRPDMVVERVGRDPDAVVVELKASRNPGYLGQGVSQLLGYLKDRPELWRRQPSGWLVAPASAAFHADAASPEVETWLVDADAVAAAAVRRFGGGAAASRHDPAEC
jgi:hypothetical protein